MEQTLSKSVNRSSNPLGCFKRCVVWIGILLAAIVFPFEIFPSGPIGTQASERVAVYFPEYLLNVRDPIIQSLLREFNQHNSFDLRESRVDPSSVGAIVGFRNDKHAGFLITKFRSFAMQSKNDSSSIRNYSIIAVLEPNSYQFIACGSDVSSRSEITESNTAYRWDINGKELRAFLGRSNSLARRAKNGRVDTLPMLKGSQCVISNYWTHRPGISSLLNPRRSIHIPFYRNGIGTPGYILVARTKHLRSTEIVNDLSDVLKRWHRNLRETRETGSGIWAVQLEHVKRSGGTPSKVALENALTWLKRTTNQNNLRIPEINMDALKKAGLYNPNEDNSPGNTPCTGENECRCKNKTCSADCCFYFPNRN